MTCDLILITVRKSERQDSYEILTLRFRLNTHVDCWPARDKRTFSHDGIAIAVKYVKYMAIRVSTMPECKFAMDLRQPR